MPGRAGPGHDGDRAEDLAAVLGSLVDDLRFAELAEALRSVEGLDGATRRHVRSLCHAGSRLLSLDAAGFADVPPGDPLHGALAPLQFPSEAVGGPRGSLDSLLPLYGLLLECLDVHAARGETAAVALVLHLLAEYLPVLAWEPVLGHAADPVRLAGHVAGTLWGTDRCPVPPNRRSAAQRVLAMRPGATGQVAPGPVTPEPVAPEQWRAYLDRWHARVAAHLRQCALRPGQGRPNPASAGCDLACGVVTRLAPDVLDDLATRMAVVHAFRRSPVVALRHAAPVGHFFGVPDGEDVARAWAQTVTRLTRDWAAGGSRVGLADGAAGLRNPLHEGVRARDGEALPGLAHVLSVAAGRPVRASTVLHDVGHAVRGLLSPLLEPGASTAPPP
ncbi:hypothetical protein [Thalassiella azotivora]